jgi:hypothetical protein
MALAAASMLIVFSSSAAGRKDVCFREAVEAAPKLINFHVGELDGFRIEIDSTSVKSLKPIKNIANLSENLAVVEVWGNIYKGNYRTRFIFSTGSDRCLLVGQEILEIAHF